MLFRSWTISQPQYITGGTAGWAFNQGTTVFANTAGSVIPVVPTATVATLQSITLNGGVVDLNGRDQLVGTFNSPSNYVGGTLTNSNAGQLSRFASVGATTFGGTLSGNVEFQRAGNSTTTMFATPQTYTGATVVRDGTLALRQQGALTQTSAVQVFGGTLQFDNSGFYGMGDRLPDTVPISARWRWMAWASSRPPRP